MNESSVQLETITVAIEENEKRLRKAGEKDHIDDTETKHIVE